MVLWIAMAVLAAATATALLLPLSRRREATASAASPALDIYRDQLRELDQDVARGAIPGPEAEAARVEIARRVIRENERAPSPDGSTGGRLPRLATAAIVAMPVAALAFYLILGSPELPDQPLASRPEAVARQDLLKLVAAVEQRLAEKPDDGKGWEVLAPVYERLGREDDAVRAYSNALRLLGATAEREANLGEAIVRANGGSVTAEAKEAFERAAALAPSDPKPRFYLAVALSQAGKTDEAIAAWQDLLKDAPADAAWVPVARQQLAALQTPGPDGADMAAAAKLSPEERQTMIEGMVASLAAQLKADPHNGEGWVRLIRSYMVLGRTDDARTALADARSGLSDDPAALADIEAAAKALGLTDVEKQ